MPQYIESRRIDHLVSKVVTLWPWREVAANTFCNVKNSYLLSFPGIGQATKN